MKRNVKSEEVSLRELHKKCISKSDSVKWFKIGSRLEEISCRIWRHGSRYRDEVWVLRVCLPTHKGSGETTNGSAETSSNLGECAYMCVCACACQPVYVSTRMNTCMCVWITVFMFVTA